MQGDDVDRPFRFRTLSSPSICRLPNCTTPEMVRVPRFAPDIRRVSCSSKTGYFKSFMRPCLRTVTSLILP